MALEKELISTLKDIDRYDDSINKDSLHMLTVIANLTYESLKQTKTKASYIREFKLNALTVIVKYGAQS